MSFPVHTDDLYTALIARITKEAPTYTDSKYYQFGDDGELIGICYDYKARAAITDHTSGICRPVQRPCRECLFRSQR